MLTTYGSKQPLLLFDVCVTSIPVATCVRWCAFIYSRLYTWMPIHTHSYIPSKTRCQSFSQTCTKNKKKVQFAEFAEERWPYGCTAVHTKWGHDHADVAQHLSSVSNHPRRIRGVDFDFDSVGTAGCYRSPLSHPRSQPRQPRPSACTA